MQQTKRNFFLLVASDIHKSIHSKPSAFQMVLHYMSIKAWGLNESTRCRNMIKEGDCVVIYAAGARDGGKQFIGYATVAGRNDAVTSRERAELLGPAKEETSTIISILRLSEVFLFEPAVKIQSVKAKLSFIRNPDSPKWGSALQGGAVSITRDDFNSIARLTNSKPFSKNISRQ